MSTKTQTQKPNQYAGSCATCGGHVPAGAGLLGGKVNGRWTVRHTDCTAASGHTDAQADRREYYRAMYRHSAAVRRERGERNDYREYARRTGTNPDDYQP